MMIKFSVNEYYNLVILLKQALLFYADKENYGESKSSPILIDRGSQAQFVLKSITDLEEMYMDTIKDHKNLSESEMLKDFSANDENESLANLIKQFKEEK